MLLSMKTQLLYWILGITFLIIAASCSRNHDAVISAEDLKHLKAKYSPLTLNYFYETVFHEDFSSEKRNNISKWNTDPSIAITGSPSAQEIDYVKKAIAKINDLNLPIRLSLKGHPDSASIRIFFGHLREVCTFLDLDSVSIAEIDTACHFGLARSTNYDGVTNEAVIGIFYAENDQDHSTRYKVVLEEIVQSLGIVGDSYTYPSSLFFENYNSSKSLTTLDIDILSLLYEQAIPANYTRKAFEANFADELYVVNTKQKIKGLVDKYQGISLDDVEGCFTKGYLLKHPKEISIQLSGAVNDQDRITTEHAISALNELSPNLKISLDSSSRIESEHGIILSFKQVNGQKEPIRRKIETALGKSCMLQKLIKTKVVLSFGNSGNDETLRQRSIIDAIYFSLVQIPQAQVRTNDLFEDKNGKIKFFPRYANLLKFIYADEFTDGFKLSDFKEIRQDLK